MIGIWSFVALLVPLAGTTFIPHRRLLAARKDVRHRSADSAEHTVKLLLLILTDTRNETSLLRNAMRNTWLTWGEDMSHVSWKFVLTAGTTQSILEERTIYDDFLEIDVPRWCVTPACQSGHLTRESMQWSMRYEEPFDYVLRTETDTFLCLPWLYSRLSSRHRSVSHRRGTEPQPLFMGHYHPETVLDTVHYWTIRCRADENFQLASRSLIQWFLESYSSNGNETAFLPNRHNDTSLFQYVNDDTWANNFAPFVNTLGAHDLADVVDDPVAIAWWNDPYRDYLDDDVFGYTDLPATPICRENIYLHPVKEPKQMEALWKSEMDASLKLLQARNQRNFTVQEGHCKRGFHALSDEKFEIFARRILNNASA